MISYAQALEQVLQHAAPPRSESVLLAQAAGRILAEDYDAESALPPFDNSAMDGFALPSSALSLDVGTEIEVCGEQAAGDGARSSDQALEIMTGARLPQGLDTVVPVERVAVIQRDSAGRPQRIRLNEAVQPGQHVRRCGEDIDFGQTVLAAGTQLGTEALSVLAALGQAKVKLQVQARVAVICTGRELVDDPSQPLESGQIRNSNGPMLARRVVEAGARLVHQETVADDSDAFLDAMSRAIAAEADLILSTGAVSMGRYDFVPAALQSIGARLLFHKCSIRPGKPILLARLSHGALFFGLPGNPVSSAVGFRFFVEAAIRQQLGLPLERPILLPLTSSLDNKPSLRLHLKARTVLNPQAQLAADVLPGQESFRLRPLLQSNAWIVIPEEITTLPAGAPVAVYSPSHLQALTLPVPGASS